MTRPGARLYAAVRRMTVGLLAVAVACLLAPLASASPESDADGAITSAWNSTGGDGGPLGPRQGGVYAVGPGFGQNFAGGKMFFTPATGAHYAQGAILEKYESLGGPADGDLGFPTIDEGPGRAPNSRNSTFSAPDKPVIFWTPDTGARVVRGAINAAWDKVGGSAGVLGVPSEDESYDGDVISQKFTGGELSWNRKTKAFTTVPPELVDQLAGLQLPEDPASAIDAARRSAGGPLGPLGAKEGDQYPIGNAGGLGQNFAGGKIFYSPETGANVVTGQVLEKYESVGGPEGDLGFPTTSETEGGLGPNSRISTFAAPDKPVIFWTPDYGAVIVRGAMNAAWDKLGGANGTLGAPMADQTEDGSVVTQRFSGGAISWDRSDNTFTTEPPSLATELSGLQIPGLEQTPAPAGPPASQSDEAKPFSWHWNWWWLLALVPVLLIAALIIGAALWHRRRGRDGFDHDPFDERYDDETPDDRLEGDRYPEREYGEGRYEQGRYEAGRYQDDAYAEEATTRFTEPYSEPAATGGSPFDGPTDAAMPVSRWAAPGGFDRPTDDEDEPSEEASELAVRDDEDFDSYDEADDLDDADVEDIGELDDDGVRDDQDRLDDEADLDEDDLEEGQEQELLTAPTTAVGFGGQYNPDNVDTAPTRVVTEADLRNSEAHSGRHAAIEMDEVPSTTAIHLPLDDPQRAPQGYPIKADTKSGLYWSPDSSQYDDAIAEIWFASEEFARTNGFVRAD
ncbi:sunset domain-containing protein [Mycolicibacterium sp. XJ870]